jgi:lipid-A-disaccharide synthase
MPFEAFNKMGLWEVLRHLPFFLSAKKKLIAAMDKEKPRVLVCVDYPGLNIPLMKAAYQRKIPVVWYIVPQVWAWKKKRAGLLGKYATFIGAIFPFETVYFKGFSTPATFVGHPLVEARMQRTKSVSENGKNPEKGVETLSLVPGSRRQEVLALLPVMIKAALLLKEQYPCLRVSVSKCKELPMDLYRKLCAVTDFEIFEGPLCDLLDQTRYAFVTSGTATLETALAGVPMVIAYKTSAITYQLLKRMIRVPYIGLPNIVADEKIVPECIQDQASGPMLAKEMDAFISSKERYHQTVEKLSRLKGLFGDKQPSKEIADAICSMLGRG